MFKCLFVQFELIINSAVSKLCLEIFHMRGSFAQLKSRKTFTGGVVDKTMKQISPFTRIGYVYNFTSDAIVQPVTVCRFFIRHFLFHGRKGVVPISTQQYYNFQKLLIVKLLNYLILNYFLKISLF